MSMTILVPLDGSPLAELALPFASVLARVAGGRLFLIHAASDMAMLRRGSTELDIAVHLDRLADRLRKSGIVTSQQVVYDEPPRAIAQVARDHQAALIVMATHGRGGIGRALYGSVADQVLRSSSVPVLLVPIACVREWPEDRPLRVLVPLDGSAFAEEVLGPVAMLARAVPVDLVPLRVVEQTHGFDSLGIPYRAPVSEAGLASAREYLEQVASKPGMVVKPADLCVDAGDPASTIARVAREQAVDLIAMTTRGRGGLARLTLGSVATGVLQRADHPLLVVRPTAIRQQADEATPESPGSSVMII